jgi:hypothetical protein
MISFVLPNVFISTIAIESTRSDLGKRIETNHQVSAPDVKYGILHVWRENREDSPIHAIGVEIWEQNTKIAMVAPIHCAGWLPNQVHEYLRQVLEGV